MIYTFYGDNTGILDSLVDYYSLEEASGNRLSQANSKYYLAPTGCSQITGKVGHAIGITGTTDLALSNRVYAFNRPLTVALWINCPTAWAVGQSFYAVSANPGNGVALIAENASGTLTYSFLFNGITSTLTTGTWGTWMHLAFSIVIGTGAELWVNGSAFGIQNPPNDFGDNYLLIRSSPSTAATINFDEIGVWSRNLSTTEIQSLYNSGSGLAWSLGGTYYAPPDPGIVGGTADVTINHSETGSGGAIGGGSANYQKITTPSTTGQGAVAGGQADLSLGFVTFGGVLGGGSASIVYIADPSTTGNGAVAGGTATYGNIITALTTGQGAVGGGSGIIGIQPATSGGALADGTAVVLSFFGPTGGAIAGGQADVIDAVYVMAGGIVGGGSADESGIMYRTGTSGMIVGGRGGQPLAITGSSGMIIGGQGTASLSFIGTSGFVMGGQGTAAFSLSVTGSSGMIMGGPPLKWLYRQTITVPAGEVSADLTGFDLHVVCVIPADHL